MKMTKRRAETFSFYDHTGIEKHLEKMALRGWLLSEIHRFSWVYQRIEPKKLHFAVTYYPKASDFDPEPSEEQKMYQEFGEKTGWEFLCSSAQMQIFCNEAEEPVPVDTEPTMEVDTIHKAMKRSFLPAMFLLFGLAIMNCGMMISGILGSPSEVLSSPARLSTGICWTMLLLLTSVELIGYFRWHHKAVKAAENGEFLDTPSHVKIQVVALVAALLALVYWLVSVFVVGDTLLKTVSLLVMAYIVTLFAIVNAVKQFLKRKKASRTVNFTITMVVNFGLAILMMVGITVGTMQGVQHGWFDDEDAASAYQTGMPLTVEDLEPVDCDAYVYSHRYSESLFLGQMTARQFVHSTKDEYQNVPWMGYGVTIVKLPFLYDLCKNEVLNSVADEVQDGEVLFINHFEEIDPTPWQAKEAYQLRWSEGFASRYLLCYEDRIIELNADWDLWDEQKQIVAEKLGAAK